MSFHFVVSLGVGSYALRLGSSRDCIDEIGNLLGRNVKVEETGSCNSIKSSLGISLRFVDSVLSGFLLRLYIYAGILLGNCGYRAVELLLKIINLFQHSIVSLGVGSYTFRLGSSRDSIDERIDILLRHSVCEESGSRYGRKCCISIGSSFIDSILRCSLLGLYIDAGIVGSYRSNRFVEFLLECGDLSFHIVVSLGVGSYTLCLGSSRDCIDEIGNLLCRNGKCECSFVSYCVQGCLGISFRFVDSVLSGFLLRLYIDAGILLGNCGYRAVELLLKIINLFQHSIVSGIVGVIALSVLCILHEFGNFETDIACSGGKPIFSIVQTTVGIKIIDLSRQRVDSRCDSLSGEIIFHIRASSGYFSQGFGQLSAQTLHKRFQTIISR